MPTAPGFDYNTSTARNAHERAMTRHAARPPRLYTDDQCRVELPEHHAVPHNFYFAATDGVCRRAQLWYDPSSRSPMVSAPVVVDVRARSVDPHAIAGTLHDVYSRRGP